jgi:hypothetical protein
MDEHFQLLVQTLLLARLDLKRSWLTPTNWTLLNELDSIKKSHQQLHSGHPESQKHCPFDISGLSLLPALQKATAEDTQVTRESMKEILDIFKDHFNSSLSIASSRESYCSNGRLKFTAAEDGLLLLGIEQYGTKNWSAIRKHYLPTKSETQIFNRYKNMSAKRAQNNPIKEFKEAKSVPLTEAEQKALKEGIHFYGHQWDLISKHYLPHKRPSILKYWFEKSQQKPDKPSKPKAEPKPLLTAPVLPNQPVPLVASSSAIQGRRRGRPPKPVHKINENFLKTEYASLSQPELPKVVEESDSPALPLKTPEPPPVPSAAGSPVSGEKTSAAVSSPEPQQDTEQQQQPSTSWSRDEDRHILTLAKLKGPSKATWDELVQSGSVPKTGEEIAERYITLVHLYEQLMSQQ